jgi:DNA-binding response OmpR family regulator
MDKKRIVIIEDSRIVVSIYRAKLQGEGFEVFASGDGEAGLSLVNEVDPDLVMLDLGLPRMSGVDVLRAIRCQDRFEGLPVLVLSGSYNGPVVEAAWAAGATGVLSKAGDTPNRVVDSVRAALRSTAASSAA